MQQRAGGKRPLKRKVAVVLLNVAGPDLLPGEVECEQFAIAKEKVDQLAIGHWRGRRIVAALIPGNAATYFMFPEGTAVGPSERINQERLG